METKHQPSRQNGIVPKCQKRKGVNFLLAPIVCLSLLASTGSSASANQWSYAGDPGFIAQNPGEMAAAKASWETPEYGYYTGHNPSTAGTAVNSPWQLVAVNASTAYALGYYGQGVALGIMDSGYRPTHEAFQTDRIQSVTAEGYYGTSGYGYRGATPSNPFIKGDWFTVAANQAKTSDYSHGTGMLGVISGIRDGKSQHGIAFGANIYAAKTGGSDSQSHGPFHDYVYWYTANKALVDAGAQVINSSWGSYVQTLDRARYDGLGHDLGTNGNLANAYELTGKDSASAKAMATVIPSEYLKDLEYQYFFYKKSYSAGGEQYNPNYPGRSNMDAIWDAIKGSGTVNVRSAGNNDWSNPYYRPAYPLFNPWAENQWVAVGGVQPPTATNPEYTKQYGYNEAGLAKWWTVSAPSNSVLTTSSSGDTNYSLSSGTSPATPVVTASMGVLLSRYPNMDAMQVRELMFTTANNKMSDGVRFLGTGQTSPSGASIAWTAPDGLPDERWGWGIPDLNKGMYGPGQFLSPMTYNMNKASLDVWSNNISQVAIKAREQEDLAWLAGYKQQGIAYAGEYSPNVLNPDGTLNKQAFMTQGILNDPYIQAITNGHPEMYDKITYEDAVKWRKEWMDERAAYIQNKIDKNLYTASLTKQGPGTLIMTGDNTYEGGTTVEGGNLYGFTESFGTGKVNVNGGRLAVLANYNDLFTLKGNLASTKSRLANINVNNGGTYVIMTGHDVDVDKLSFEKGSKIAVDSLDGKALRDAYFNNTVSYGTVTANTLTGYNNTVRPDYAFFNVDVKKVENYLRDNSVTLKGTISRNNDVTVASYAESNNGLKIANVIGNNRPNAIFDEMVFATRSEVRDTLDTLSSDMFLNADTASIVNSLSLSRIVKSQAQGAAKTGDKTHTWATGLNKSWLSLDFGQSDMDADFFAGLVGYESQVSDKNTLGLFLGAGSSNFKDGRYGSISSDDFHGGIYGIYKAPETSLTYGVMFTGQDRDMQRILRVGDKIQGNASSPHTNITQFFAEAASTKFNNDKRNFEPYVGMNVLRLKSDGYSEKVGDLKFSTGSNSQTVEAATVGIRASLPLSEGKKSWALKGDVSGTWFFGDTMPEARMDLANVGYVNLKGGEIKSLLNFSLGIDANITDSTKLSLSYSGSYNRNIQSNGIVANFRYTF